MPTRVSESTSPCQMKSAVRSTSELAQVLGISRWTVSRALNGHPGISPATVQRIRDAARRHGFAPSVLGRGLRTGKTSLIGICLPDLVDYFLTSKIARLQDALETRGYQPIMQLTNGTGASESSALGNFSSMHCAGVISIASRLKPNDPGLRGLATAGIRVVKIDPLHPTSHDMVASDRAQAMCEALAHLHELGHRRVVALGIDSRFGYGRARLAGLEIACRKLGWKFERDVQLLNAPEIESDFDAGMEMAAQYFALAKPRIPALLALNDRIALGALRGLQSHGLTAPRDFSLIGYDNADFAPYTAPGLTSLDPQVNELIDAAVEMLLAKNKTGKTSPAKPILITPKLISRESTGPAPKR